MRLMQGSLKDQVAVVVVVVVAVSSHRDAHTNPVYVVHCSRISKAHFHSWVSAHPAVVAAAVVRMTRMALLPLDTPH